MQVGKEDTLLETVVGAGDALVAYCLHLKDANYTSPRGVKPTLATLYRVRSGGSHEIESETPLFSELVLGGNRPDEVRIEPHAGWLTFRSGARRWRAVPWGLEAWRELARGVFDVSHKPVPQGMFNLVIGGEQAPDVRAAIVQPGRHALPMKTFITEPR